VKVGLGIDYRCFIASWDPGYWCVWFWGRPVTQTSITG
jgi:hypothetical protein